MPILVVELEALPFRSNTLGIAGEEYAVVDTPPSKAVKSSNSGKSDGRECKPLVDTDGKGSLGLPWRFILPCGMLPVLCVNSGTGGRVGWFCWFG